MNRETFQGVVLADGFWLSADWVAPALARRRLLRFWTVGTELFATSEPAGMLLLWPEARRTDTQTLPGSAVRRQGAGFICGPQAENSSGLSLPWGGQTVQVELRPIDPAEWLQLDPIDVWIEPTPQLAPVAAPVATPRDLRDLLHGLPPLSARRLQLAQAQTGSAAEGGAGWFRWMTGWFTDRGGRRADSSLATASGSSPSGSFWQQLGQLFRLGRLFRWQHLAFLRRLMAAVQAGDWDEALRHALPLDGQAGAGGASLSGLLQMRMQLTFSSGQGGSAIALHEQVINELRQGYRRAFKALDEAGEIDKAAYVLAELLWATDEAIAYLSQHQRQRSAAELAELRALAPARIIALWVKAGDLHRAVCLAQRHQAFAEALQLLHAEPRYADALRRVWSRQLYGSGQLLLAIEVLWPVIADRAEVCEWIQLARTQDDSLNARLLAREAGLFPEQFDRIAADLDKLLPDTASNRAQLDWFADSLSQGPTMPQTRALARVVARTLRCNATDGRLDRKLLERLERLANDPYRNADRPKEPKWPIPKSLEESGGLQLRHDIRGSLAIRALSPVRDGHCLLALGEAGSVLIDPRGRILRRMPCPAAQLIGDGELRISMQPRERGWLELGKLDLSNGRSRAWVQLQLEAWSENLVNGLWAVAPVTPADQPRVQLLDVAGERPAAIWDSGVLPGRVRRLAFGPRGLSVLLGGGSEPLQVWHYRVPELSLASRSTVADFPSADNHALALDSASSTLHGLMSGRETDGAWELLHTVDGKWRSVWRGIAAQRTADLQLLRCPFGLLLLAGPTALDPESARAQVVLLSDQLQPLVQIESTDHSEWCVAADSQFLWVAAGGALLRVEQRSAEVRWLVP